MSNFMILERVSTISDSEAYITDMHCQIRKIAGEPADFRVGDTVVVDADLYFAGRKGLAHRFKLILPEGSRWEDLLKRTDK